MARHTTWCYGETLYAGYQVKVTSPSEIWTQEWASPSKKRRVPPGFSTSTMFSSESCSKTLPSCSLQISLPSVKSWKNHSKRKEVGSLPQDCTKQCNNCVPILFFFFPESIAFPSEYALWRCLALLKKLFFGMPQLMQRNIVAFHPFCLLEPKST